MTNRKKSLAFGYIRVSTPHQSTEKNRSELEKWAKKESRELLLEEEQVSGQVPWQKRNLGKLLKKITTLDPMNRNLVIPEMSRLSRSWKDILEILSFCLGQNIRLFVLKENFVFDGSFQSKIMGTLLSLMVEWEREMISLRVREGLNARREKGIRLGRPKGSRASKLDDKESEIEASLRKGVRQKNLAKLLGVHPQSLSFWLKSRRPDLMHRSL